jgi:hypothetical protein
MKNKAAQMRNLSSSFLYTLLDKREVLRCGKLKAGDSVQQVTRYRKKWEDRADRIGEDMKIKKRMKQNLERGF